MQNKDIKQKINKNKHYIMMLLIALIAIASFSYVYMAKIRFVAVQKTYTNFLNTDEDQFLDEVDKDTDFRQTFICKEGFSSVAVRFSTYLRINTGEMNVKLIDCSNQSVLQEWSKDVSELEDNSYFDFVLDTPVQSSEEGKYEIDINITGTEKGKGITLTATADDKYTDGEFYINGVEQKSDLCIITKSVGCNFVIVMYTILAVVFTIFAISVYYMIFIKKSKIENIFLTSIMCLGIICSFIQAPYSNYDDPAHIYTAYRYSNRLLGISNKEAGDNMIPKRLEDNYEGLTYSRTNITSYKTVYENLFKMAENTELKPSHVTYVQEAKYAYLPTTIGITLARLLGLGKIPLLMMGKLFNLTFFALCSYFAIKKIPFGKITLFIVALLPMNIGQVSTFSYDSVLNGLAYLFTAYCLYLAFSKNEIKKKDVIVFLIIAALLAPLKKIYVLMCFIALIIPRVRFEKVKKYKKFILCTMAIVFASYLFFNVTEALTIVNKEQGVAAFAQVEAYTFSDIVADPVEFIKILVNSIWGSLYSFMFTGILSFYLVDMNALITLALIIMLLLSTVKSIDEETYLDGKRKLWIGLIICGLMLGLYAAGFTWTPKGETMIQGVQGRYLLPFLPFALLALRNSNLTFKKNIDNKLMYIMGTLNVFVLTNLFISILIKS